MKTILRNSYPLSLFLWKKAFAFGVFIMIFLFAFKPFGLQNIHENNRLVIVFGYGLLTFLIMIFNQYVLPTFFPSIFQEANWTVLSQIIWLFWNVLLVAIINYYYSIYVFDLYNSFNIFLTFLFYTVITSIIPIFTLTLISHNRKLKENLEKASKLNNSLHNYLVDTKIDDELHIVASNGKNQLKMLGSELLYVESMGNYVIIRWMKNEKIHEKTIRNTLKNIEQQLEHRSNMFKTHKAFIVNLDQILRITRAKLTFTHPGNEFRFRSAPQKQARTHIPRHNYPCPT